MEEIIGKCTTAKVFARTIEDECCCLSWKG